LTCRFLSFAYDLPPAVAMRIDINDPFYFSEFQPSDKDTCLEHFKFRGIYENTLRLPFPYTEADFDNWMGIVEKTTKEQGQPVHWAIRNSDGLLIGGLGFDDFILGKSHRAEIGYWLAKPFWGPVRDLVSASREGIA
jgi:[ribosomal protein S5]-alanine N-acetyltransferase